MCVCVCIYIYIYIYIYICDLWTSLYTTVLIVSAYIMKLYMTLNLHCQLIGIFKCQHGISTCTRIKLTVQVNTGTGNLSHATHMRSYQFDVYTKYGVVLNIFHSGNTSHIVKSLLSASFSEASKSVI